MRNSFLFILLISFSLTFSCKTGELKKPFWSGSGSFFYEHDNKLMRVFYLVPEKTIETTPIVILFHGANRNPIDYLKEMTSTAIEKNFILVVPEFSEENFPNESAFQMGNIFKDGDNPRPSGLNPESEWTLSVVEPIFEMVKKNTISNMPKCYLIGHSAGAQFLHRMLLFKKDFPFEKAVISAAGWYTVPDTSITFPYGLKATPYDLEHVKSLFGKDIIVQVGSDDNNPNAPTLRKGEADKQGEHRLSRAQNFYNESQKAANFYGVNFNWELKIIAGLNHNFGPAIRKSAELIFD